MAGRAHGSFGKLAVLFGVTFLALVMVLALLGNFGLPDGLVGTILGGAMLVAFAAIGVNAGNMQTSDFFLAGRLVPAAANGAASAAAFLSGMLFLGLAGVALADPADAATLVIGTALGFLVLAVAIAPYFRKSGAFGVPDFFGIRFGGPAVRIAAAVVVVASLLAALGAALATATFLTATLLSIPGEAALSVVCAVVLASTLLGGLSAVTRTAVIQYVVMAFAFLIPVAAVAMREFSLPIPQLTFGYALKDAALLALASGRDLAAPVTGEILAFAPGHGLARLAAVLSLAAGVASLPHMLMRLATVTGPHRARQGAAWALLFVLLIVLAAPAYAAFARLVILREVADSTIDALPDWIFTFGAMGLVQVCGVAATSVDAITTACGAMPGFDGTVTASDLVLGTDGLALAAPAIFDLPYTFSALLAVGGLAATIAAANAIVFAVASALGHDLYSGVVNPRASAGRHLIITRLAIVLTVLAGAWLAARHTDDVFHLALASLSLSAGGLFPALILAVWWKRANAIGIVAGIVAGFAVTALLVVGNLDIGPVLLVAPGAFGLTDLTAAIVGVPVGFIVAVAASLATGEPSEAAGIIVDAMRRPGGTPFVQESESR
jgi:cation/acetate symporter